MAANQNVIDELVVKLTLDAKDYQDKEKLVINLINRTEISLKDADKKQVDRDSKQKKRNQETLKGLKELAAGFKKLALTAAGLLGVGSVGGVVGLLTAFAGMETGLRRAAVSTGMSNREMQAWGATARRLGADAQAGAAAVADLAREQKQFNITGQAPTLQAFARMGVRTTGVSPVDILAQAQQVYRHAAPAQRGQIEAGLAAQGVSADLIVAIKSETDIREAYNRSLAESTEENSKALNTLYDTISAVSNAMTAFANTIATAVQPYVAQFGEWASQAAVNLGQFVAKVLDAGGGLDGFMKVLNEESPGVATNLKALGSALVGLGQTALVIVYGLKQLGEAIGVVSDWIFQHLGGTAQKNVSAIGDWLKKAWSDAVQGALGNNPGGAKLSAGAAARINSGALASAGTGAGKGVGAAGAAGITTAKDLMANLVGRGFTVPEAAAIVANAEGESSLRSNNPNMAGGGRGAHGLFQLRGSRLAAFEKKYGISPDKATVDQQLDFMTQDPYERSLLKKALEGPGGAAAIGARFNNIFEGNGVIGEDARRGTRAQQLASAYGGTTGGGVGQQINIQSMSVQANSPQEFVGGITRQSNVQSYNSAVR